jgi:hypothetical protein
MNCHVQAGSEEALKLVRKFCRAFLLAEARVTAPI